MPVNFKSAEEFTVKVLDLMDCLSKADHLHPALAIQAVIAYNLLK
jgi:2-methylcitrate dehydratase PrpD